jgi:putative FmdB family regulatory protein
MPMYEFRCKQCRLTSIQEHREPPYKCPYCDHEAVVRVFSFNPLSSFQPHYNTAVGKWVNNEREFRDGLKEASAAATARTGVDTNYVPVEWQDRAAFKPTDEGMDNYHRTHHNNPDLLMENDHDFIS